MTAVLDRVPLDQISTEAREVHFGRTLLTILAGFLFGLGWLAAKAVGLVWLGIAWAGVAVKVGWMEARKTGGRTDGAS
jgi:hypothetical protein